MSPTSPKRPNGDDAQASTLDEIWAKSPPRNARPGTSGERLTVHLAATLHALLQVRDRVGTVDVLPGQFWVAAAWAALVHDAGKVADHFQRQLGNGGEARLWGQRHELLSLGFIAPLLDGLPATLRRLVATGVATHHRPLFATLDGEGGKPSLAALYAGVGPDELAAALGPVDPVAVSELARWLASAARQAGLPVTGSVSLAPDRLVHLAHAELDALLDSWEETTADEGLVAVLLQGAVTTADHLSSAHGHLYQGQPLGARYHDGLAERLQARGHGLYSHQEAARSLTGHLLLRSPTGSGKTEAVLLWAATNIDDIRARTGGEPRLFYTLPYLASINAMTGRMAEEVGDAEAVGVSHSRAASYHLAHSIGDDESDRERARKATSRARATRLFREPVRVGTPYQLLRGALAGPLHSGILLDTANSVFVLDELHAYDPRRLGMILAAMELWTGLGGRVAVISATLPNALATLVATALGLPDDHRVVEPPGNAWPSRHRLRLSQEHLTEPSTLDAVRERLKDGASVLVVANNVRDAQTVYDALGQEARALHGPDACHLLHSRFRRLDRSAVEHTILDRYGTDRPRQPGLLVATQTVEVSLNVDFDTLHTAAAPLEALLQRFGRVNRTSARAVADVVIHRPEYRTRNGEEFADGVYEAAPTGQTWDILAAHDGEVVDERAVTGWLDQIYDGSDWGERWRAAVDDYRTRFREDFLTFEAPFTGRDHLTHAFDDLFDGTEAILAADRDAYRTALDTAGRVVADEYLIPLPQSASTAARWDRDLQVRVVDADYSTELGLGEVNRDGQLIYRRGEVI